MTAALETPFDQALEELATAYERVPFFGAHLDQAGLKPQDIRTPADFRRVPPTRKADYRRNFPAGVLMRGTALSDPFVFPSRSSGTAGDRLLTATHSFSLAERLVSATEVNPLMLAVFGRARPARICRYAPPNCSDVECALPSTTTESRTLPDGTLVLPVAHDLLTTPAAMLDQAAEELGTYRPHWLYVDPTHLAFLVRALTERGIRPPAGCGGIVLTYNLVTAAARRQIEEFFGAGVVVAEVSSMSELGWLGMECPTGSLHLNTGSFYLELLDGDQPCPPGEFGELVVTSLGDQISPHIRYRTGDLYRHVPGECPCGHPAPRAEHHGRGRDTLRDGDRSMLTARQLDALVGPADWLDCYQLRQTGDEFLLRYVPSTAAGAATGAAAQLRDRLRAALGDRARVSVAPVPYIESERSGKLLSCLRER
jgi:phenylacetate-CoA ligase